MYINFNYTLPTDLYSLASQEISDLNSQKISGWVDQADINAKRLNHCSLFMICELDIVDNVNRLSNPVVIVAKNDSQAMQAYKDITNKSNGTIQCEITNNCSKIKVEPTGIKK